MYKRRIIINFQFKCVSYNPHPIFLPIYKSWATLGCITAEMNELPSKDVGSGFLMSNFLSTSHAVKEVEGGVKGNQDVDRTQEKSAWWLQGILAKLRIKLQQVKTVFSFAYCLELSHVLNIILVKFRKERPSFIWTQQFYF